MYVGQDNEAGIFCYNLSLLFKTCVSCISKSLRMVNSDIDKIVVSNNHVRSACIRYLTLVTTVPTDGLAPVLDYR